MAIADGSSAVANGEPHVRTSAPLGGGFHLLLWFHLLYSQVLLSAAKLNLRPREARKA
jgi:hypothetical protein